MIQVFSKSRARAAIASAAFLAFGSIFSMSAWAQATPGGPPAVTTPPVTVPAQTPPVAPSKDPQAAPVPPGDVQGEDASVESLTYPVKPTAAVSGKSNWEEGFETLMGAFKKIRTEMQTAGLEASGRPIAVFLETDDEGFKFDAMIPLSAPPAGGVSLANGVRVATTPTGAALKFQHRGAYEDIDSTYEAITAYLDEKGLNAANMFIEEYVNDVQGPDDNDLAVNIIVFLK